MKWYGWTIFSLVLTTAAVTSVAVEPLGSERSVASSRRGYFRPAVVEQTNVTAQPERIGSETPVLFRQATWNIWAGTYNGYVYTPDACDYRPPCVDHLWDGYESHYLRCTGLHWGGRFWGCRQCGGCGLFGHGCGHHVGCGKAVGCDSCVAKVPDCGVAKPGCEAEAACDCGGGGWHPGHHMHAFKHKCHHFWHHCKAHWSCACGTDVSCACGVETKGDYAPAPASDVPPAPMPEVEEKKASAEVERETRAIKLPAVGTGLKGYFQR